MAVVAAAVAAAVVVFVVAEINLTELAVEVALQILEQVFLVSVVVVGNDLQNAVVVGLRG